MFLTWIGAFLAIMTISGSLAAPGIKDERIQEILKKQPMTDGHNDLPNNLRRHLYNDLTTFEFNSNLKKDKNWMSILDNETHTDLPRLRSGGIGTQFWAAYVPCDSQYKDAVPMTLEQIDVTKRLINKNRNNLYFATSAQDIRDAHEAGKIASLIGVEGGHSIQFSLGILRTIYELGTRYMTLTHACNTPWADTSVADNITGNIRHINKGLSPFGLKVVEEMNRLGMIVDLSHTSKEVQKMALAHTKAPIMYSHSSAFSICNHHRNVHDSVLKLVAANRGVVMVNFFSKFLRCDGKRATMADVVEHVEHIRKVAGVDNLGFGGDYDGVKVLPVGLEDVSKFPDLLKALMDTGNWSDEDLMKIAGGNILRVLEDVERVRDDLKDLEPIQTVMTRSELKVKNVDVKAITSLYPGDPWPEESKW